MTGTTTLDAALEWAARGFRVFPLRAGSKKPAPGWIDWPGRATTDAASIRDAWALNPYNVGVDTTGLIVADVDDKNGKTGTADYLDLGMDFDTLTVRTPSGGRHAYHSGPSVANSAGKVAPGVDVRGFHGYVIAPGSWLDPEDPENKGVGGFYTLDNDAPVKPVPPHFLARLEAPRERHDAIPVVELDLPEALALAADYLDREAPLSVEGQGGDMTAYQVAARLKDLGVSEAMSFALLAERWNERCEPPWDLDALKAKVENAYRYGTRAPGASSPEAYVGDLDIAAPRYARPASPWVRHGDDWRSSVAWLYHETLPQSGLGLLVAPTGSGKTFLALHLAHSLATGRPFFGVEPEQRGGCALLMGEGGGGVTRRMQALGESDRLPIYALRIGVLNSAPALLALEAELNAVSADMQASFGVPLRLAVLDTFSASGVVDDEDDNAKVATAVKALEAVAGRLGVFLLVVHHPPKNGTGPRGAGALPNNVDVVIEIQRDGKAAVRQLELTKAREAETRPLGAFTLVPVTLGADDKGREIKSCIVSTSTNVSPMRKAQPVHAELFVQSVENALAAKPALIEGEQVVELLWVEDEFREAFPGARTTRAITAAWRDARTWAESTGAVRVVEHGGRTYFSPLAAMLAA